MGHCNGKLRYPSRDSAETGAAAMTLKNARRGDDHPVHVYQCPTCGAWHVGHVPATMIGHYNPATYQVARSPRPLSDYIDPQWRPDGTWECRTCGEPIRWATRKRVWSHLRGVDHPPDPVRAS